MANSIELRFQHINETPAHTTMQVAIYLMQDLGLDVDGNRQWGYALFQNAQFQNPFRVNLDAGIPRANIVTRLKAKLSEINTRFSLGYAAGNQICTL